MSQYDYVIPVPAMELEIDDPSPIEEFVTYYPVNLQFAVNTTGIEPYIGSLIIGQTPGVFQIGLPLPPANAFGLASYISMGIDGRTVCLMMWGGYPYRMMTGGATQRINFEHVVGCWNMDDDPYYIGPSLAAGAFINLFDDRVTSEMDIDGNRWKTVPDLQDIQGVVTSPNYGQLRGRGSVLLKSPDTPPDKDGNEQPPFEIYGFIFLGFGFSVPFWDQIGRDALNSV